MYIIKTENEIYGSYAEYERALYELLKLVNYAIPAQLLYNDKPCDNEEIRFMINSILFKYEVAKERMYDWLKNNPE
jgi:hypothetical protein